MGAQKWTDVLGWTPSTFWTHYCTKANNLDGRINNCQRLPVTLCPVWMWFPYQPIIYWGRFPYRHSWPYWSIRNRCHPFWPDFQHCEPHSNGDGPRLSPRSFSWNRPNRDETGSSSGKTFEDIFFPVLPMVPNSHISLLSPLPSIHSEAWPLEVLKTTDSPLTISVGSQDYSVTKVIFKSKSIVGRATRIYLVEAADGLVFVLKNSWMSICQLHEATYLEGLSFPFCPTLINYSAHRNTRTLWCVAVKLTLVKKIWERRHSVTRPAGVHISDFSSLWELMVAFMDIALGMYGSIFVGYLLTLLPLPQPLSILYTPPGRSLLSPTGTNQNWPEPVRFQSESDQNFLFNLADNCTNFSDQILTILLRTSGTSQSNFLVESD